MVKINLRNWYSFYEEDCFVEVSEELAETLHQFERMENAQLRKVVRHRAYLSLDRDDGIARAIAFAALSPESIYEIKITRKMIHAAISTLSDKQAKRIFAHYYLEMSKAEIARAEGVGREAVGESIQQGLKKMALFLKNYEK